MTACTAHAAPTPAPAAAATTAEHASSLAAAHVHRFRKSMRTVTLTSTGNQAVSSSSKGGDLAPVAASMTGRRKAAADGQAAMMIHE